MVEFEQLEPWRGKNAVVLRVNSPLGVAISEKLLKLKMFVIGIDDDENHIENLQLREKFKFLKTNLLKEEDILDMFQIVEFDYGGADMLVNIMKVSKSTSFLDSNNEEWKQMFHLHSTTYTLSVREMLRSMVDRKVELGQIVNVINFSDINVSNRSQHRLHQILKRIVNTLTKYFDHEVTFRMEYVRISSIANVIENIKDERRPTVKPNQFADALEFVISTPLHVQVQNIDLEAF